MKRTTHEWVRKAEDDFHAPRILSQSNAPLHDQICFHCQQSAEKYLKALVEKLGLTIVKTHDLELLPRMSAPHHLSLRALRRGLAFLSNFSVDIRYPGDRARKRQATAALRWAATVRNECRLLLGIRAP